MSEAGGATAEKLKLELGRLQKYSAFEVLGVPPHATGEAVRAAFLAKTKRFHPARFAREAPEIVDLATEIFLLVRKAYSNIADDTKRTALKDRFMGVLVAPPPATPAAPAPAAKPITQPPAGRLPVEEAPSPPAAKPITQPPAGRTPEGSAPPPRAAAPPPKAPVAAGTQAPKRGTGPVPVPVPPPSKKAEQVKALLEAVKTRQSRLDQGNKLIREGRWAEAKEVLRTLAAEDPQSRKFRQRYQLALGLEHRSERRFDEAVRELERALSLDPNADDVADALRVTREQRDAAKGILSKFFGR